MKKIKMTMLALCSLFALNIFPAHAGNDRAITVDQLPEAAQLFLKKYFAEEQVAFAKQETDFFESTTYEVVFLSRKKVEFRKDGAWKEVDCRFSAVPAGIVPEAIVRKVGELYKDALIFEIDRDRRDIEVKLSNGLELTFDLQYNLVDIDD